MHALSHSTQPSPVHRHRPHLSGAGYLSPSPLSFEWNEVKEAVRIPTSPLSPSAMGSFVNKAKAMLRGKRNSWAPSNGESAFGMPPAGVQRAPTFHQSSHRPVPQRQATAPLLSNQPVIAGPSRPSRRRTGGSMQIGPPQLIDSTMFPKFAQDSTAFAARASPAPPPLQTDPSCQYGPLRNSRSMSSPALQTQSPTETTRGLCDVDMLTSPIQHHQFPRSASGSTTVSNPTVGLRAGVVATFRRYNSRREPRNARSPFEYASPDRTRSRVLDGLDLGVSETMVAISEAGLLHDSDASVDEREVSLLFEALSKMLASSGDNTDGEAWDNNAIHSFGPHSNSRGLDSTGSHSHIGTSHDIVDEYLGFGEDTLLFSVCALGHNQSGSIVSSPSVPSGSPVAMSLCHPMSMNRCLEHMTTSPPESLQTPWRALQPAQNQVEIQSLVGPQGVEIVPNEVCAVELGVVVEGLGSRTLLPPAIPARSAHRPISRSPSYMSDYPSSSTSIAPVSAKEIPVARRRRDTRDMFVESQVAHLIKGSRAHTGKKQRKSRSHSRLGKPKTRSGNYKRVLVAGNGETPNEWVVVPSVARSAPLRSSGSAGKSLYASPSLNRIGAGKIPPTRARMVKSPSIRSGLVRHGLHSSRSRNTLHASGSRASGSLFSSAPSTRSLPDNSNAKGKAVEGPVRPPRSHARPRQGMGCGKENLPAGTSAQIDELPLCESGFKPVVDSSRPPIGGGAPDQRSCTHLDDVDVMHASVQAPAEDVIGGSTPSRRPVPPRNPARAAMGSRLGNRI